MKIDAHNQRRETNKDIDLSLLTYFSYYCTVIYGNNIAIRL